MLVLRDYQERAVDGGRVALRRDTGPVLIVGPTGMGKTVVAAHMLGRAVELGGRGLFLAHRDLLIDQTGRKLDESGLEHGVIQANHWRRRPDAPIQVASTHTLHKRGVRPEATLVIADEAHVSLSPSYRGIIEHYRLRGAAIVGLTATPFLINGGGLGSLYKEMVVVAQTRELIEQGYLSPVVTYRPSTPDLANVRVKGSDFDQEQLAGVMSRPAIVGDVVKTWLAVARGRTTAVFCVSKKHAAEQMEEFLQAGIPTEYMDDETPLKERMKIQTRLVEGRTLVVCNVGIVSLGWDLPRVSCVVMARPTMSLALYLQMVGRGMRPDVGKSDCLLLDHAGNWWRHGSADEPRTYTLDPKPVKRAAAAGRGYRTCLEPSCYGKTTPATRSTCQSCGTPFPAQERQLLFRDGELEPVPGQPSPAAAPGGAAPWAANEDPEERARLLAKWWATDRVRGYHNQAFVFYRHRYGEAPDAATRAAAALVQFPLYLVRRGRCHCGAKSPVVRAASAPHLAQVLCGACGRGLAWVSEDWAPVLEEYQNQERKAS